ARQRAACGAYSRAAAAPSVSSTCESYEFSDVLLPRESIGGDLVALGNMDIESIERPSRLAAAVAQALAGRARRFPGQYAGIAPAGRLVIKIGRNHVGAHLGRPGPVRWMACGKGAPSADLSRMCRITGSWRHRLCAPSRFAWCLSTPPS